MNAKIGKSEETILKQRHFRTIMRTEAAIIKAILAQGWAYPEMLYIDCNAGPGTYLLNNQHIEGSPIIALEEMIAADIPFKAHLIEIDESREQKLLQVVNQRFHCPDRVRIYLGDSNEILSTIKCQESQFGILYSDPNATCPGIPALRRWYRDSSTKRIDWLLHIGFAGIKRAVDVRCQKCPEFKGSLHHCFAGIKKHLSVQQEARGCWQWTFLLGCNDDILNRKFSSIGFVNGKDAETCLRDLSQIKSRIGSSQHKGMDYEPGDLFVN